MSVTSERLINTLPPNVRGKCRGTLKLTILEISPKTPTSAANKKIVPTTAATKGRNPASSLFGSGGIFVKFIWWGQSYENCAVLKYQPSRQKDAKTDCPSVEYSIQTNCRLFQNYLSNCEPIEVKLTAATSNLQIGTAFVRISKRLVGNCTKSDLEEIETVKIFSPRNTTFGELKLKFEMIFQTYTADSTRISSSLSNTKSLAKGRIEELHIPTLETERSFKSLKSDVNKLIAQKSARPVSSVLSSNAMDFLTGREMSEEGQTRALEEIQNCSPLESLVTTLTNRMKTPRRDVYNRIDSLRLAVKSITVLAAGMRELETSDLGRLNFTVEAHISPNLHGNGRNTINSAYDIMRFYSEHIDVKEKRIDFNRDALRSIRIGEFVDNAYIAFTIWSRPFGSRYSRCFGNAKFQFASLLETGNEMAQEKRLVVKSCTDKVSVGQIVVKVTLGTKGVHFGEDFMTIIHDENLDKFPSFDSNKSPRCKLHRYSPMIESPRVICPKCNNNETNKNATNSSKEPDSTNRLNSANDKSPNSRKTAQQTNYCNNSIRSDKDKSNRQRIEIEKSDNCDSKILLQGLLYVGSIRNVRELQNGGYFLVCRAFWKEDATSTDFCQDHRFNFMETFPVINNDKFLERTRNNHLDLELWQKFEDTPEQMVGIVKLPLHQFFIAFRDNVITSHLSQAKLPVISIDGWVNIASPLSGESCGQLQTLLAIGTEEQLEYLKASRGLCSNSVYDGNYFNQQTQIPVPQFKQTRPLSSCDAESQTNFENSHQDPSSTLSSARRENLSDLLGNFIENLAQRLPPSQQIRTNEEESTAGQTSSTTEGPQIRRTSDLLDVLQKALVTPPENLQSLTTSTLPTNLFKPPPPVTIPSDTQPRFIKILLEIENALHLPHNKSKVGNKKMLKRSSGASKCKQSRLAVEEEPSAYVSFQAEEGSGQMIKSHEGMVYATNVVEKCCDPVWNRRFEIYVPVDLMKNDEKRFILKVWRKRVTDLPQCRLLPTPLEDAIIGFAAVDLNVLLAGMPCIAGWFNIVDFNGRINGQIKVNVRPLEDLQKIKEPLTKTPVNATLSDNNLPKTTVPIAAGIDLNNSILSRAIKRKFNELEEITERLRARLLDVTGEPEKPIENFENAIETEVIDDQLDEFEHDLNTECDEDEFNSAENLENFGWLGVAWNLEKNANVDDESSTSESQERIRIIEECLRRTELGEETGSASALFGQKERNPPEGETASSKGKTHLD